ncbi:MAG TPA: PilZ domain-containing protein [Polyangiaceae bacterium]|nr:PilZ domain-containing protein [Polyangiaceae bacterium]
MNDPMSLARSARENLAHGLAALQSPGVPPQVMDVAEPIAHAMSALHRIETTHGASLADNGALALTAVRRALAMLQSQPYQHPAVNQAMEAIASSLSLVHTISQSASGAPPALPNNAAAFAGTVALDPNLAQHARQAAPPTQPSPAAAAPQYGGGYAQPNAYAQPGYAQQNAYADPGYAQQHAHADPGHPQQNPYAQPGYAQPVAQPPAQAPNMEYAQQYAATHAQPMVPQQMPPQPAAPPAPAWQPPPAPPGVHAPAPQPMKEGAIRVEAELGAHSATNFYKGLSGNDVIDSGGIFIATYQIPEIGQDVFIRVSMPGGYEFEAAGIVRWTRDMPHSGADAPPGFGAQFTQISPEGRQLVYRYVRNREPLFHDDL